MQSKMQVGKRSKKKMQGLEETRGEELQIYVLIDIYYRYIYLDEIRT